MSITSAMNAATSGLLAAQAGIAITSDNISNVNTAGYARKTVVQDTRVAAGAGVGVDITEVRRITDRFLNEELRIATAEASRFGAMGEVQSQLTALLGDPTGDRTIVASLDKIFAAAGTLAASPETTATRSDLIDTLSRFGDDLDRTAEGVRDLRRQTDLRIDETVNEINSLLADLHDLNNRISGRQSTSDNSGLEDQRARKLDRLAELVDVRTFDLGDNVIGVTTAGGLTLLDRSPRELVHPAADSVEVGQVFPNLSIVRIDTTTGARIDTGSSIDSRITSGELKGLLEMRDSVLPDLANELGAWAGHVADEFNRVHNDFTAVPAPATLTGRNTGAVGTDPHGFTGIAAFHAFDSSGNILATATVDFGAIGGTVNDVINAVNAGLGGLGTLSLANGTMQFSAGGAATGVGIAQDAANPSDMGGRGFSHRFGLNDLVRTTPGPGFDTALTTASAHGFTGQMTLSLVGPSNERAISGTVDFGAIGGTMGDVVSALNTAFNGTALFSLDADGALVTNVGTAFNGFSVEIVNDTSLRGTTGLRFADMFGLGSRPVAEMATTLDVRSDIAAQPGRIATGAIDAARIPAIGRGDNAGAIALQALGDADGRFGGAGRLPAMTATLSEIGADLLGRAGQAANDIATRANDRLALKDELGQRVSEVSGVNLDEEMGHLITFQTAFNASARVISATRDMLDALINI
ncbi:MAG: flagellar hook-associated protein FlgK [Pseudomonadota bacterium]|nr:flagellar hook-associated protein FlgK [Pseudomonadota bacterium]